MKLDFHNAPMRFCIVLMLLLALRMPAAETNVIYGYSTDAGLALDTTNVTATATLLYPNPRVVNNFQVRQDPVIRRVATNGYYAFTNLQWGRYQLILSGKGTPFTFWVFTNTSGTVPIGSLISNVTVYPPNPATNYYTMPQVDALIDAIDTSGGSGSANIFSNSATAFAGVVSTNTSNSIVLIGTDLSHKAARTGEVYQSFAPGGHLWLPQLTHNTNLVLEATVPDFGFAFFDSSGILQQSKYGGYLHSINVESNSAIRASIAATNAATLASANAAINVLSNLTVTFTITTNLGTTNFLVVENAGTVGANGGYTNVGGWWAKGSLWYVTNKSGMWTVERSVLPDAYTNATPTGLFTLGAGTAPPPAVYFPSNRNTITTNWFIAGASYKVPLENVDFEDFGAKGDGIKLYAATVAAGNLICTNAAFTSADVGKRAFIYSTPSNTAYVATHIIGFNNATNVTLATNYTQSTAHEAWYGTGNYAAITNTIGSIRGDGIANFNGKFGGNYLIEQAGLDATSARYAVINIPTDRSSGIITNTSRTIVIRGQTPPVVYPAFLVGGGTTNTLGTPNVGTTLLNFAKPVANSTNVFVYHDGTGAGGSQFARERVLWENITLRQPGKPTHHGMYLARAGTTYLRNFQIDVDQSANWLNYTSGLPPFFMEGIVSNANSIFGIYGPDPYNYAGVQLEDVTVAYHGTAYRLGEHTVGMGKTIGIACGALLYADGAFGSQGTYSGATFDFLYPYLCQYRIVIATNSTAREPLTVQNLLVEEGFPRADIGPLVYDPLKRGDINIQAITGNAQNTTIESTNGSWNNTILNFSYDRGVIHSNGVVYGSGVGLTSLNASQLTSGTVPSNRFVNIIATNINVTGTTTIPAAIRSSSAALALVGYYLSSTAIKGYFGAYTGGLIFLGDDGASTNMTIAVTTGIITTRSNINSGGTITANNGFISPPLVCTTATTNWSGQGIISTATNTTIFVSITGQEGKRFTAARTVLNTAAGGQAILYCTNGSFFSHGSGTFATNVTVPISSVLTYYCVGTNFIAE